FFFSSRRRHTRSKRDWSSDVCSSDLSSKRPNVANYVTESSYTEDIPARTYVGDAQDKRMLVVMNLHTGKSQTVDGEFAKGRSVRSEERRVGKECRSWWGDDH